MLRARVASIGVSVVWLGSLCAGGGPDALAPAVEEARVEPPISSIVGCVVLNAGADRGAARFVIPAMSFTILDNGPTEERLDLVFVGDGYRENWFGVFADHVNSALLGLFAQEPFKTYRNAFNVHIIKVVSEETGVDHDPTFPTWRDTALDMGFFCSNIDRLLCVDPQKAWAYALNAPGADQVMAVANSTRYGGAGYVLDDLATASGGNTFSPEIFIHELGHSLADLGDEYEYSGPVDYASPEPLYPNISLHDAQSMFLAGAKWWRWLGYGAPLSDGPVGAYEGGDYSVYGVYRPTFNSKMRTLGRPFNPPSIEAFVLRLYEHIRPIEGWSPASESVGRREVLLVDTFETFGQPLVVAWRKDGVLIGGANSHTLDLSTIPFDEPATITVEVIDATPFVRDEVARQALMTQTHSWTVDPYPVGDVSGDGVVGFEDLNLVLAYYHTEGDGLPGDDNGDGRVDFADLNAVVSHFGEHW